MDGFILRCLVCLANFYFRILYRPSLVFSTSRWLNAGNPNRQSEFQSVSQLSR